MNENNWGLLGFGKGSNFETKSLAIIICNFVKLMCNEKLHLSKYLKIKWYSKSVENTI